MDECKQPECARPIRSRGYCRAHYLRLLRGKDMDAPVREPYAAPFDRFVDKVDIADSGCWEWTGWTNGVHYGKFFASTEARKVYAHRWLWEQVVGPIPDGLTIDHLCRNTLCVNPDHLEPVTTGVNTARGTAYERAIEYQRAKTHCPQGHEYTLENTYRWHGVGGRMCRKCSRDRMRARRAAIKEGRD
jgi:hypothetical protein